MAARLKARSIATCALLCVAGLAPAQQGFAAVPTQEEEVVISVIGDVPPVDAEGTFEVEDLIPLGVSPAEVEMIEDGEDPDVVGADVSLVGTSAVGPSSKSHVAPLGVYLPRGRQIKTAGSYDVISSWNDRDGRRVNLRRAAYDKITVTHNVNAAVARIVSQRPGELIYPSSGTRFQYRLRANEVRCRAGYGCYVINSTVVRESIDYRSLPNNAGTFGVVTVYCEGIPGRCPDYVKNALNI